MTAARAAGWLAGRGVQGRRSKSEWCPSSVAALHFALYYTLRSRESLHQNHPHPTVSMPPASCHPCNPIVHPRLHFQQLSARFDTQ